MAWPPIIPPNDRLNDTITADNHPADHNQTADALTELVARVDTAAYGNGTASRAFPAGSIDPISLPDVVYSNGITLTSNTATVPVAGIYLATYDLVAAATYATGLHWRLRAKVDGAVAAGCGITGHSSALHAMSLAATLNCPAGGVITFDHFTTNGANTDYNVTSWSLRLLREL